MSVNALVIANSPSNERLLVEVLSQLSREIAVRSIGYYERFHSTLDSLLQQFVPDIVIVDHHVNQDALYIVSYLKSDPLLQRASFYVLGNEHNAAPSLWHSLGIRQFAAWPKRASELKALLSRMLFPVQTDKGTGGRTP